MNIPKTSHHQLLILLLFLLFTCSNFKNKKDQNPVNTQETITPKNQRFPIYTSSDQGQTWKPLSLGLPDDTHVSFIKDFGHELLIATDNKGLFLTTKNLSANTNISESLPNQKINALHVSQNDIYVGVYNSGVFISKDQGQSWESLNKNLPDLKVQAILKINQSLILGTDSGVFKSENHGDWKPVFAGPQIVSLNQSENNLLAGTSVGTLLSSDSGNTWKWIHQEGAAHNTEIINGSIIIMNVSGDLFRSKDWGNTWESLQYRPRDASYVYDFVTIGESMIMSNNYGIHRSTNGGDFWNLIYPREDAGFFDLHIKDNLLYGGTRNWNEWRNRKE